MSETPSLRRVIKEILHREGLRPGRDRGQNFLVEPERLEQMVAWAKLRPGEAVVEIGPGLGTLTRLLLEAGAQLTAVELDRGFHRFLAENLADQADFTLIHGDGVRELRRLLADPEPPVWKLVANLPYQISSPVILELIRHPRRFARGILTIQRELAIRLTAPAGHPERSGLSALIERTHRIRPLALLGPGSFWPAPRVDSSIIELEPLPEPRFQADPELYPRLLRLVFASRRKTVRNNLRAADWPGLGEASLVDATLAEAEIDGEIRAERLTGEALGRLSLVLARRREQQE